MQLYPLLTGQHFICDQLLEVKKILLDLHIHPHGDRYRLTNEEPDKVRVVLGKKVIQIHEAGESAFIVFGNIHGYRLSVRCLKLKIKTDKYQITSMAEEHRQDRKLKN